jgi:hypothetical protein
LRISNLDDISKYVTKTDDVLIIKYDVPPAGPRDMIYCWAKGGSALLFSFKKGSIFAFDETEEIFNAYFRALVTTFPGTYRYENGNDLYYNGKKLFGIALNVFSYISFLNITMDYEAFDEIVNPVYTLAKTGFNKSSDFCIGLDEIFPNINDDDFAFRFASNFATELKLESAYKSELTETERIKLGEIPPKDWNFGTSTPDKDDLRNYGAKLMPAEDLPEGYKWNNVILKLKQVVK